MHMLKNPLSFIYYVNVFFLNLRLQVRNIPHFLNSFARASRVPVLNMVIVITPINGLVKNRSLGL